MVVLLVRKGKKKHKTVVEPSKPAIDPNSISISDTETKSVNEENEAPNEEKVEEEPENHTKNTKYTKEDFIAKKHGSEREPWVQKPMPFLIRNTSQRKTNTIISFVSG